MRKRDGGTEAELRLEDEAGVSEGPEGAAGAAATGGASFRNKDVEQESASF